jgi:hypothetical protein
MRLMKLKRALDRVPPPPCVGCGHYVGCAHHALACEAFAAYAFARKSQSMGRKGPNHGLYARIFEASRAI